MRIRGLGGAGETDCAVEAPESKDPTPSHRRGTSASMGRSAARSASHAAVCPFEWGLEGVVMNRDAVQAVAERFAIGAAAPGRSGT